jgi:hypothetical protein
MAFNLHGVVAILLGVIGVILSGTTIARPPCVMPVLDVITEEVQTPSPNTRTFDAKTILNASELGGHLVEYRRGETICGQGDPSDTVVLYSAWKREAVGHLPGRPRGDRGHVGRRRLLW